MRCSDIEFVKRHARRSRDLRQNSAYEFGFAQVRGQNKIHIAEIQLFSQISQSTRLKLKIFLLLLWTPVSEISFFSVYCKFKGSRSQRNLVKPGKKTFFFMQLARCVNI